MFTRSFKYKQEISKVDRKIGTNSPNPFIRVSRNNNRSQNQALVILDTVGFKKLGDLIEQKWEKHREQKEKWNTRLFALRHVKDY